MEGTGNYLVEVFTVFFSFFGGWQNFLRGLIVCIVFGFVATAIIIAVMRRHGRKKDQKDTPDV